MNKSDIANATVTLLGLGGRGVLVPGNVITTAAHCVNFSTTGGMVLGDWHIEGIETSKGENLLTSPYAVEPITDIALLGAPDDQEFYEEANRFEEFCERTKPVPLCLDEYELMQEFPVFTLTHKGTWVSGSAIQVRENAPTLFIEFDEQIEGGTSGSPIVNVSGELVGIISNASISKTSNGSAPRPHLALPVWVYRTYFEFGARNDK